MEAFFKKSSKIFDYLFVSSYLEMLLPNQGLLYYMKTRILLKKEQHEITKGQNQRKTGLKWRKILKKGKILTFLQKDTNSGATIAHKKFLTKSSN